MVDHPQHYGATNGADLSKPETFSISEPYAPSSLNDNTSTPLRMAPRSTAAACCCCCSKGESDALKGIVISFFVFAAGVTVALIVQIASGEEGEEEHALRT
jgi:hypothetical protein